MRGLAGGDGRSGLGVFANGERWFTGALNAQDATAYGLELGGQWMNFYFAGECNWIDVSRVAPAWDVSFSGWYVHGSWILTGAQRKWSAANGGFGGVKAVGIKTGAWGAREVAGRCSLLDLNDNDGALGPAPPANGVPGGEQTISMVGRNSCPNQAILFLLEYQDVGVDRLNPGTVGLATVGAQIGPDYQTLSLRSQFAF